ncbi:MAG: hypothetical protein J7M38_04450 [Armatimonadetes bacterium]|nr:hypothetical protein [Armatimonadota bacterium]
MNRVLTLVVIIAVVAAYGCGGSGAGGGGGGGGQNHAPTINSVTPDNAAIWPNGSTNVTCQANDQDSDNLTYTWSAPNGGTIQGGGATVQYNAPSVGGVYTVQCRVDDGHGGSVTRTTQITVGATVRGHVVDMVNGLPVEGVQMSVGGVFATTDANGDFTAVGVGQGTHQVTTAPGSPYTVSGVVNVTVDTPGSTVDVGQNIAVFSGPPPPPF